MKKLRKAFVVSVMFTTVLTMSAVVVPEVGAASAGDLIKMDGLSSVYYLAADGKRYVFPNEATYFSWYSDFSGVVTIAQSELESYPLGANVTIRPGTVLVKITTDPKVYAVEPNGSLIWVNSESAASTLYGANWAGRVIDVPDAFFTNYTVSTSELDGTAYPTGSLVKFGDDATVYYIASDGTARGIADEAAFTANRFSWNNVITATIDMPTAGTAIAGAESDLTDTSSGAGGTAGAGTGLTVSLASDTPASANIADNTYATFSKFNFTASNDGDVTVNSIKITRFGVGSPGSITRVYLYEGVRRLVSGTTVSTTDNTSEFNNIGWTIPAGTTKPLSVFVDGATLATDNHGFKIAAASDITTDGAAVSGSFPLSGNIMAYTSVSEGSITITQGGAAVDPTLGETGATVVKFTMQAGSNEDAIVQRLRLRQTGGTDMAQLSNIELYKDTTKVADGVKDGKFIDFTLDPPYTITAGLTKNFSIKLDIGAGPTPGTDTIDFDLYKDVDLYATGGIFGFGLPVTDSFNPTAITIQGGDVTFADNGPVASDVKKGGNDVTMLNFAITSNSTITITDLDVVATTTVAKPDELDDVRIVDTDTGQTLMGPNTPTGANSGTAELMEFSGSFIVSAGTTRNLAVTADIANTTSNDDTFKVTLATAVGTVYGETTALPVIEDSEGNTVTSIVPSTHIVGETMTVNEAYLKVALASLPTHGDVVKGEVGVDALGLVLTAGGADDINVSSITLIADAVKNETTAEEPENVIGAVGLYDGSGNVLQAKKALSATPDTVTFDKLNIDIAAGDSFQVIAKVDISGSLTASSSIALDLRGTVTTGVTTNVTATDSEGSAVTVYDDDGTGTAGDWQSDVNLNDNQSSISSVVATDTADVEIDILLNGTLTITNDADTPSATIMVAGSTGNVLSIFDFTSAYEAFTVEQLTASTTSGSGADFTSLTISYPKADGSTREQTGYFSGDQVVFTGMTFYVPKDQTAKLTAKGNMNTVTAGATAGHTIDLDLELTNSATFKVVSASGVDTDPSNSSGPAQSHTDKAGSNHRIFRTKPTVAFVGPTTATLTDGTKTLLEFTITADAHYNVSLYGINLQVTLTDNATSTDLQISNLKLYNKVDMSTALTNKIQVNDTAVAANTTAIGSSDGVTSTSTDVQLVKDNDGATTTLVSTISAGTTVTYVVQATVSGSAQYDSIIVRLADDTDATANGYYITKSTPQDDNYAIVWRDGSSTITTNLTSQYVTVLPTDYSSVSR